VPRWPSWLGHRLGKINNSIDWLSFKNLLFKEYADRVAKDRYSYAIRYHHCLLDRNLTEIKLLSDGIRLHVLKALSVLSKFLGIYNEFNALIKAYGIKWSSRNTDNLIIARLLKGNNKEGIIEWIRDVKQNIPRLTNFMDFITSTGLRYEESVLSYGLIIDLFNQRKLNGYYNTENEILEHFRFPIFFIRRTKKAYISFVSNDLIGRVCNSERLTKNIVTKLIQRRGIPLRFSDVREYWATLMTKNLSQPEIDFLQGRIGINVFMRNYFNPMWIKDLKNRTIEATNALKEANGLLS